MIVFTLLATLDLSFVRWKTKNSRESFSKGFKTEMY